MVLRQANDARWRERCEREFQALRRERLATAELECQKLVNAAAAHLTLARLQRAPCCINDEVRLWL